MHHLFMAAFVTFKWTFKAALAQKSNNAKGK